RAGSSGSHFRLTAYAKRHQFLRLRTQNNSKVEAALSACRRLDIHIAVGFRIMVIELNPRIIPNSKNLFARFESTRSQTHTSNDLEISLGGESSINRDLARYRGSIGSAISAHRIVECADRDCLHGARSRLKHVLDDLFREPKIIRIPKGQTA